MAYRMGRQQKPSAAWWIEKVPKRKERQGFAQSLKEFLGEISLHGYRKLVEEHKSFGEKLIWFGLHLITLGLLVLFLRYTMNEFLYQHMDVTLFDPLYPVEKVPLPTVSICSINRISNASAWKYAQELSAKDPRERDAAFFYENIKMLAFLYRPRLVKDLNKAIYFQSFLDLFDTQDDEIFFDTRKRMNLLTPTCDIILKKCFLGASQFDCQKEFDLSWTQYGSCCTFNMRNKYGKRQNKPRFYGRTQGLTLLLRSLSNDTFFNVYETDGFIVLMHSDGEYADVASGGVREKFIPSQQSSYLEISPKVTESVPSIRHYSPKLRACYFPDELPKLYGDSYSLNKCITRCRIRSIIVLCECLPFYYPHQFLDTNTETVHCTLQHLECLNRYEFKWMNVITQRQAVRGLEHEMEDGLYCPECLPSCSDIQYKVSLKSLPLDRFRYTGGRIHNITDVTKLQLYFAKQTVPVYRKIIRNSFFEVFSTVGNICGIVTGFSLVAVLEMLYFFGGQIFSVLWDGFRGEGNKSGRQRQQKLIICP